MNYEMGGTILSKTVKEKDSLSRLSMERVLDALLLAPLLFDDLSNRLNDIKVGCTIGTTLTNHLMYADDLVSLSPSAMILSLLLSVCSAYGIVHDIKYNSAKSNVMIFCCNKIKHIHRLNFVLNNVLLTRVTKYKYLGHCKSDDLSDDDDMARQYRQIDAQRNALLRTMFMCTECVKMTLFRSLCTSLYACELWWQYRSESLRKLCVAYNNVFRFVCSETRNCSASHMFVSRGLNTSKMLIRKVYIYLYDIYKEVMQYNLAEHCWM